MMMDLIGALPMLCLVLGAICLLVIDLCGLSLGRLYWLGVLCICGLSWMCSTYFLFNLEDARELLLNSDGVIPPAKLMALSQIRSVAPVLGGFYYPDSFSFALNTILLLGLFLSLLMTRGQLSRQGVEDSTDVDVLMILATVGGMIMVGAADLIALFLGFELLSISVYVLSGLARKERASSEGALKYFLLGAFSSAFLLYGMVLVYGEVGSMQLAEIGANAASASQLFWVGFALIAFGFAFKIGAVPFQFWVPDVYQGAPTSLTAFMAVVVKASAFGAFLRLVALGFSEGAMHWNGLVWALSILTMTIGNLLAIRQQSLKRMLAYSSIAHAGYALMGFLAIGKDRGAEAIVFYLFAYALMTIASFGVALVSGNASRLQYQRDDIKSLSGLGWSSPALALVMSIAMLSLAGMPPLAGFMGKFFIFSSALSAGYTGLVIVAALNSVASLYYYLRVILVMYFGDREEGLVWDEGQTTPSLRFALGVAAFGILIVGIFSDSFVRFAQLAAKSLG